jgi:hypothetical protein
MDVANGLLLHQHPNPLDARAVKQPPTSGITYKVYIFDAFQRDTHKWRATIRRLDGKKIRVAVPPSVRDEFTTSADALTAERRSSLQKKRSMVAELSDPEGFDKSSNPGLFRVFFSGLFWFSWSVLTGA